MSCHQHHQNPRSSRDSRKVYMNDVCNCIISLNFIVMLVCGTWQCRACNFVVSEVCNKQQGPHLALVSCRVSCMTQTVAKRLD